MRKGCHVVVIVLGLHDDEEEVVVVGPFEDMGEALVYIRETGRWGQEDIHVREVTPPAAPENN